jgi:hypothetical protein
MVKRHGRAKTGWTGALARAVSASAHAVPPDTPTRQASGARLSARMNLLLEGAWSWVVAARVGTSSPVSRAQPSRPGERTVTQQSGKAGGSTQSARRQDSPEMAVAHHRGEEENDLLCSHVGLKLVTETEVILQGHFE